MTIVGCSDIGRTARGWGFADDGRAFLAADDERLMNDPAPAGKAYVAAARRLDAVVFDLDGTLVDTAPDIAAALAAAFRPSGLRPPGADAVRTMVGDGARVLIARALAAAGDATADVEALYARFLAWYVSQPCRDSRLYDGALDLLDELAARGVRSGICTNKPQGPTDGLLEALGIRDRFDSVIGGDALPWRKPDPRHLTAVLDRLGAAPDRAVMVGDSRNDVAAARAAGIPAVLVSFGYTAVPARELGADAVIDHLPDLPAALARLAFAPP
jgi:phosphoglycolate phosphatase